MGEMADYCQDLALAAGEDPFLAPHKNSTYDGQAVHVCMPTATGFEELSDA